MTNNLIDDSTPKTALRFAHEIMGWTNCILGNRIVGVSPSSGDSVFEHTDLNDLLHETYKWIDSFGNDEDGDCKLFLDMSRRVLDGKTKYYAVIYTEEDHFRAFTDTSLQEAIMQACLNAITKLKETEHG